MIATEELVLGLLLMTSAFFLALAFESYWRSGIKAILWVSFALSAHVAATLVMVVVVIIDSSVDEATRLCMVAADGIALVVILALGVIGGRRGG